MLSAVSMNPPVGLNQTHKLKNISLNKNSQKVLPRENPNLDTEESRNEEESKCPSKVSDLYEGQCKELSEN
jgi:hypothetical protein